SSDPGPEGGWRVAPWGLLLEGDVAREGGPGRLRETAHVADGPGITAVEELGEVAFALLLGERLDLVVDAGLVALALFAVQHAHRDGEFRVVEVGEEEGERGILLVVDQDVRLGHAVLADLDDFH